MRLNDVVAARSHAARILDPRPLTACLAAMSARERVPGVMLLAGRLPCGPLGISVGRLQEHVRTHARAQAGEGLSVLHAVEGLRAIRGRRGMGAEKRLQHARALFEAATRDEGDFLIKLAANQLRSGSLDRLIVEAVARVGELPPALVWQAVQCTHDDLARTATAAFSSGESGLNRLIAEVRPGSRREPELEELLLEDFSADGAAVYGDWLLQHGQPHGQLIAAAVATRAEQRKRAWSKALKRFARQEGIGPELLEQLSDSAAADWEHGFLRRLWLPGQTQHAPDLAEAVLRLLASSVAACLHTLAVDTDDAIRLDRLPRLPALEQLRLDLHSTPGVLDLSVLSEQPRLRHLLLEGNLPFASRDLSGIRDLSLCRLDLKGTYDLAPLAGTSVVTLVLSHAIHVELEPLSELPQLRVLGWGQRRSPSVEVLESIPRLEAIHLRDRPSTPLRAWAEARGVSLLGYAALFEQP